MKPSFNPKATTVKLHFGATADHATVYTPSGVQTINLSQFRAGQSTEKARNQRHSAIELLAEFVCRERGLQYHRGQVLGGSNVTY